MLLKLAVLSLKQVHDSVVLKSPTVFYPGNQRIMFPLGGKSTLFISPWLYILDKVHFQRKVLRLSPLLVATAWNQAEVNLQSEELAVPWICQVLGTSLHGSHSLCTLWGKGTKHPSVPNHLFKDAYVRTKPHKTEMVSASKIIQLMSSFRVKHAYWLSSIINIALVTFLLLC